MGSGSAPCDEIANLPVAVQYEDEPAQDDLFAANIATGSGSDLPAIFGSTSMRDKDSVILLRKGKETIVFPGPGGYKIEWSPGTKRLPMCDAPSGHLVIPCDMYAEVTEASDPLSFWTDHTRVIPSGSTERGNANHADSSERGNAPSSSH